ncbi:olfactory receptor 5AS1-like [Bombina bombina]|uniref:olfactory receptor 5AS1-like n=1 Tax=Bombina bombina TaxID=8345 RepID=UPI00235B21AE|nr:olfactory receptor 5AS1-like [Bombina bombina]
MLKDNHTMVTEFILVGLHNLHSYRILIFIFLTIMYTVTIAGNVLIIVLVSTNHQLQSPMYIFLSHLSFADILISTNISPNALQVILLGKITIPAANCLTQLYFFGASAIIESCLLTVMSYDRYLAICKPLHYSSVMNYRLLQYLVIWSWTSGFVVSGISHIFILNLNFCSINVIDHFFCDLAPILELSCSDTSSVQIVVSIAATFMSLFQFVLVIITYICIFTSILQISSSKGRQKAFSTCSAHLIVVCMFYGTMIILYIAPSKGYSVNLNKILSVLNTVVTPLFNPVIYTLRNKDIRVTLKKKCSCGRS